MGFEIIAELVGIPAALWVVWGVIRMTLTTKEYQYYKEQHPGKVLF